MKSNFIIAMMITTISALVNTSCKKDQNPPVTNSVAAANASTTSASSILGVPDTLNVPEGNKLVEDAYATGFQIYEVQRSASDPNVFSWVNIAPLAKLFKKPDFTDLLINHFAGPTWEFLKGPNSGQKVVAKKVVGITKDNTAIQWLLLKADASLSSPDNQITFVQRLFTVGGLAPTTGADEAHLGQLDSIPYTARYFFYEAQH